MHPMFVPLNQTLAASRGCESSAESICPIITMSCAVAISVVKVMMMVDISFFSIYVCLVLLFFLLLKRMGGVFIMQKEIDVE